MANRFLASFATFLSANLEDSYVDRLVEGCFEQFVRRNLRAYPFRRVYAIGSVAYYFRGVLRRVLEREGFELVSVQISPIDSLARYHSGIVSGEEQSVDSTFRKITEEPSYYDNLETMSVKECLQSINREDSRVADAVERAMPAIEALVSQLIPRLKRGGRLFYMGAGTSGRLGVLDASEVPPTFGMPPTVIIGIIAGGDKALRIPVEGAEDDMEQGWRDLEKFNPTPLDTLVGIAASGTTPYVVGVLKRAGEEGLLTAAIVSNRQSPAAKQAQIAIETVVGPEFVTGSSRMKSGTAQKLVCNMITTTAMIGIGRVKGNRMVNMQLSNKKLVDRGTRMLVDLLNLSYEQAYNLLLLHGSVQRAIEAFKGDDKV
ncbi:MAG: N-acetylmuramic acid 6-phosphate etherase [Alistipes sp.]|nr:N-acetylmuramic acid 6-phosphate etherase [Alistipes sp.]